MENSLLLEAEVGGGSIRLSGEIRVYEAEDPEISGDRYHVFEVTAKADVDELLAWDDQWHRRLCQLPDRIPGRYRLCIVAE
jgi:hypothetical protein